MPPVLSNRLQTIAGFVPPCALGADIGADHGALSAYLLREGRCEKLLCTDLRRLPLEKAKTALASEGLLERAEFLLGDGLSVLGDRQPDCVIIAGLGGDTIRDILFADPALLKNKLFVLQPMSKHTSLRIALADGFCVQDEALAEDGGRVYPVLRAFYDGEKRREAPLELLCGKANLLRRDPITLRYLHRILASLVRRKEGRQIANLSTEREDKLISALSDHLNAQEKSHDHS